MWEVFVFYFLNYVPVQKKNAIICETLKMLKQKMLILRQNTTLARWILKTFKNANNSEQIHENVNKNWKVTSRRWWLNLMENTEYRKYLIQVRFVRNVDTSLDVKHCACLLERSCPHSCVIAYFSACAFRRLIFTLARLLFDF